jgi:hypothetical protein
MVTEEYSKGVDFAASTILPLILPIAGGGPLNPCGGCATIVKVISGKK